MVENEVDCISYIQYSFRPKSFNWIGFERHTLEVDFNPPYPEAIHEALPLKFSLHEDLTWEMLTKFQNLQEVKT